MSGTTFDYVKAYIGDTMHFLFDDMMDCSCVLVGTLDFRGSDRIGKTMFFKTIANLLIDFGVRRFLKWEPHPFGAVPIVPAKGGVVFRQDTYLNSDFILEMKLWGYQQEGRRGYFMMDTFHRDGIARKMKDVDRTFLLENYSKIYSSLPSNRLNQLATCRDETKTFLCADYEENLWLERMGQTLDYVPKAFDRGGATLDYVMEKKFKRTLTDAAIAAKQISVKIDMFRDNGALLDLLEDCKRDGPNMLIHNIMGTIEVTKLTERLTNLEARGRDARELTKLLRLICSAFGIEEEPELARIDPSGQYKLFSDYITPLQDISIRLGKSLGVKERRIMSARLIDLASGSDFHCAVSHLAKVYHTKLKKIISEDKHKADGFKRSRFSVVDKLSFLDFQTD